MLRNLQVLVASNRRLVVRIHDLEIWTMREFGHVGWRGRCKGVVIWTDVVGATWMVAMEIDDLNGGQGVVVCHLGMGGSPSGEIHEELIMECLGLVVGVVFSEGEAYVWELRR